MGFGNRGIVADKWSGRLLWVCAIGSAIGIPSIFSDFFLRFFSLVKQWLFLACTGLAESQ
uniref:Uncharacterized protein n=1 Tax=Solanum tuberosum TaxID=4113 RepID=M1AX95_SOLTU